jgi:DNA-binding transcriptional LysR family regulator
MSGSSKVRVDGPLAFNSSKLVVEAALAGSGLGFVLEDRVKSHIKSGALIRVLADWCAPFPGYYLYYPSRRQTAPAFSLLVDALRWRGRDS